MRKKSEPIDDLILEGKKRSKAQPKTVRVTSDIAYRIATQVKKAAEKYDFQELYDLSWVDTFPKYRETEPPKDMSHNGKRTKMVICWSTSGQKLRLGDRLYLKKSKAVKAAKADESLSTDVIAYQIPPSDLIPIKDKMAVWSPGMVRRMVGSLEEVMNKELTLVQTPQQEAPFMSLNQQQSQFQQPPVQTPFPMQPPMQPPFPQQPVFPQQMFMPPPVFLPPPPPMPPSIVQAQPHPLYHVLYSPNPSPMIYLLPCPMETEPEEPKEPPSSDVVKENKDVVSPNPKEEK